MTSLDHKVSKCMLCIKATLSYEWGFGQNCSLFGPFGIFYV